MLLSKTNLNIILANNKGILANLLRENKLTGIIIIMKKKKLIMTVRLILKFNYDNNTQNYKQ